MSRADIGRVAKTLTSFSPAAYILRRDKYLWKKTEPQLFERSSSTITRSCFSPRTWSPASNTPCSIKPKSGAPNDQERDTRRLSHLIFSS
jgi:hypothetical protein